jgi:hypothetical protein
MEAAIRTLAGSGAIGAILAVAFALLAVTIGVLAWALKRLVESALQQQERFVQFMDALTKSLNAIGANCLACRQDSVGSLRDLEKSLVASVEHTIVESHEKARLETTAAIDGAVTSLEESLTGVATSIRASNKELVQEIENQRLREKVDDLSRPHDVNGGVR